MPKIGDPPDPKAVAESEAAVNADQDAVLSQITGISTQDTPAQPQKASTEPTDVVGRDSTGKFAAKAATEEVESTEASEPAEAEGVNSEDYDKALKALQFDKVPVKVLAGMSHDEIIEWGNSRAKNHGDWQALKEELANLQKAKPAVEDPEVDNAYESELAEIAEVFGEEVVVPFRKVLQAADANATRQASVLLDRVTRMEQSLSRRDLEKEWKLSDASRWQAVLAVRNEDRNEYESETDALRAAAKIALADDDLSDFKRKLRAEHKARSSGQPMTESRTTASQPTDGTTIGDLEDQLLNAITSGKDEEIQRVRGLMGQHSQSHSFALSMREGQVGMPSR